MSDSNLTADEFAAIKRDWPETLICWRCGTSGFGIRQAQSTAGPGDGETIYSVHGPRLPAKPDDPGHTLKVGDQLLDQTGVWYGTVQAIGIDGEVSFYGYNGLTLAADLRELEQKIDEGQLTIASKTEPLTPERPEFYAPGQAWGDDTTTYTLTQRDTVGLWEALLDDGDTADKTFSNGNLAAMEFIGHHEPRQGDSFIYGPKHWSIPRRGSYWGTIAQVHSNGDYGITTWSEGDTYVRDEIAELIATHQIELATPINLVGGAS